MSPAGTRSSILNQPAPLALPLPMWFQKEFPFWIAAALWCFLPTRYVEWWNVLGLPFRNIEVSLIVVAGIYFVGSLVVPGRGWAAAPAQRKLLGVLFLVLAYGTLSLTWSGLPFTRGLAMESTLILGGASPLLAYLLIASRSQAEVRGFLWRVTLCLCVASLVYLAQSLFSLGLRSAIAQATNDFGIDRVRGPLFESSTGHFILLPALAFAVQETLDKRVNRWVGMLVAFSLAVTIIGLGSRAGLALVGCFVLGTPLMIRGGAKTVGVLALFALGGLGAWNLVFSRANTTRLEGVSASEGRLLTHLTAAKMLQERPITESLVGSGYGSYWPWNATEFEIGTDDIYLTGRYFRNTPYGALLYHSHSTPLMLIVELGVVGGLFVWTLGSTLLGALKRCASANVYPIFACGVAVATLSMLFDLFVFRRPTRDTFWWLFVLGLLALAPQKKAPRDGMVRRGMVRL